MLLELNVVEGAYFQDILNQPDALRRTIAGLSASPALTAFAGAVSSGQYKRVVLTGMGSSLYALYPMHLQLTACGLPALLIETAELIHYLDGILGPETLVIAVSQSGKSAEILRLLENAAGRSPVIGVTNDEASPLARRTQASVLIRAGVEASVSCKTYVCSLAALEWLGAMLTGRDLAETTRRLGTVIPLAEKYLADWRQHVAQVVPLLSGIRHIFVAGRGPSLATAQTGGLILKESTRVAAEGMSCAAFRHGPFEVLSREVLVVILAGDARVHALNLRLADDIRNAGGNFALVESTARLPVFRVPSLPDSFLPILEILPIQMLSLAIAARLGRVAGRFDLAAKITSTE